jgi:hypothetical protein
MTIKDRGNKKWTSLMLVEHKEKLKRLKEEEKNREKPDLTGDELQRLDYMLQAAWQDNHLVRLTYYHKKQFYPFSGQIVDCDKIEEQITVNSKEDRKEISLSDIVDIKIID